LGETGIRERRVQKAKVALAIIGIAAVVLVAAWFAWGIYALAAAAVAWVVLLLALRWRSPLVRRSLVALVIAITCYALSVLAFVGVMSWPHELPPGEWPWELSSMAAVVAAPAQQVKSASLGRFVDSSYSWRVPVRPERLQLVVSKSGLATVSPAGVPDGFWNAFPFDWKPPRRADAAFFATPGFPVNERGPDGAFLFGMYDGSSGQFYVWMKSNF
jgi:hypothetical protein